MARCCDRLGLLNPIHKVYFLSTATVFHGVLAGACRCLWHHLGRLKRVNDGESSFALLWNHATSTGRHPKTFRVSKHCHRTTTRAGRNNETFPHPRLSGLIQIPPLATSSEQ